METLSDRRKARAIGISNFNETQVKTLLNHSRITAAINQIDLPAVSDIRLPWWYFNKESTS